MIIQVEMILNCRPALSCLSRKDSEEPLTPSQLLCGHLIRSLPDTRLTEAKDSDTDVQPQDLDSRLRLLSNVTNHFWKRRRNEYLLELRNLHRNATQNSSNRAAPIRDLLFMTKTSQVKKSALERLMLLSRDLIVTSAGRIAKLRRPVQRLNHLEVCWRNDEPETAVSSSRAERDPAVSSVATEQQGPNCLNLDVIAQEG